MPVLDGWQLRVYQRSLVAVTECYKVASRFPRDEQFGLAAQLRRAAISVLANIAEGNGRLHRGDYIHHISIARGSVCEIRAHFDVACALKYVTESDVAPAREMLDHVSRMLLRLARALREGKQGVGSGTR